jgi:ketosteroid isomerase-like protein
MEVPMRSSAARWSLPILLAALVSGCTSAPPAPPAVDQAAIGVAIDGITPAFTAAIAARDTNAIVNMYADDAHFLAPNAPRADGKDAIRQAWVGFLSTPGMELTPISNTKMISEAGDMVVELGSYVFKWQDPSGKTMSDAGKYATVYKLVNGEWKIVVDTFNSDMPIPGM